MKERLTVRDLKDYLESLDPIFDDASVAIMKPGEETIIREEIVFKDSLGIVQSPTKDKERQAMLSLCSREDSEKIEEIYRRYKDGDC